MVDHRNGVSHLAKSQPRVVGAASHLGVEDVAVVFVDAEREDVVRADRRPAIRGVVGRVELRAVDIFGVSTFVGHVDNVHERLVKVIYLVSGWGWHRDQGRLLVCGVSENVYICQTDLWLGLNDFYPHERRDILH